MTCLQNRFAQLTDRLYNIFPPTGAGVMHMARPAAAFRLSATNIDTLHGWFNKGTLSQDTAVRSKIILLLYSGTKTSFDSGTGSAHSDTDYRQNAGATENGFCFFNNKDKSVWERNVTSRGGEQWKLWPNKRAWERGDTPNSIWPEGHVRK